MSTHSITPEATASNPTTQILCPAQPGAVLQGPPTANGATVEQFPIPDIVLDEGLQAREHLDQDTIDAYATEMRRGISFPPVILYYDGQRYYLANGWHRVKATVQIGATYISATVHQGTRRDALVHAAGANATNGLRRTNADKRKAVELLLRDEDLVKRSNNELARMAGVDHKTVGSVRAELEASREIPKIEEKEVTRQGQQYTQRGKSQPKTPQPKAKKQDGQSQRTEVTEARQAHSQPELEAQPVNEPLSEPADNHGKDDEDDHGQATDQPLADIPEINRQDGDAFLEPVEETDENGRQAETKTTITASDPVNSIQDDGVDLPAMAEEIEAFLRDRYPHTLFKATPDGEQVIIKVICTVAPVADTKLDEATAEDTHPQDPSVEEPEAEAMVPSEPEEFPALEKPAPSDDASSSEAPTTASESDDACALVQAFVEERCQPSPTSVPHDDLMQALAEWLVQRGSASLPEPKVNEALHRLKYKDVCTTSEGWRWEGLQLLPVKVPAQGEATVDTLVQDFLKQCHPCPDRRVPEHKFVERIQAWASYRRDDLLPEVAIIQTLDHLGVSREYGHIG